jgi:hypothetical protein
MFELEGLSRAEMMNTRGFKDGRKSWIDVMPAGGPKMRVTHEILEGLGELRGEELAKRQKATREARARYLREKRRDIDSNIAKNLEAQERARSAGKTAQLTLLLKTYEDLLARKAAGLRGLGDIKRKKLSKAEIERRQRQLDRDSAAIYKRLDREWNEGPSWAEKEPPKKKFDPNLNGLEGFGAISRAEKAARARAAKAKAKEEARASDPLAPTAEYSRLSSRREQYRPRYDIDSLIRFNLYAQDSARETGRFDKLSDLTRQYEKLLAKKAAGLGSLEGIGSSFALMWAAAGAVALLVLSDSQKAGASSRPYAPDPAAQIILQDLNRARAAQGLPPLTR